MTDEIREMYKEGFHIEVISRLLNVSLNTVLEAIWGKR
jgi:transposase-like protein